MEDKGRAMAEASRITRKGGRCIVIEPNLDHPQRRRLSNRASILRKAGFLGFVDPVETFQRASEVVEAARSSGLACEGILYTESLYKKLSFRQALQKLYAFFCSPVLPERYIFPNFLIRFRKCGT